MVYVSSDWHGCSPDVIENLLKAVEFSQDDYLYVLGDVIDRGKNGIELLNWIMSHDNVKLIMGNHESMMLINEYMFDSSCTEGANESLRSMRAFHWLQSGGNITAEFLKSVSENQIKKIFSYLKQAPLHCSVTVNNQNYILTHSGFGNFNEKKSPDNYLKSELLWNRAEINDEYYRNTVTVFGHTPTYIYGTEYSGKIIKTKTWINIDTGDGGENYPMLLRLDDMREFYYN